MSVQWLDNNKRAICDHGNGHKTEYEQHLGIYFHKDTPYELRKWLKACNNDRLTVRIYYGETDPNKPDVGRDWYEENDVLGRVGNSMGPLKVPLLIEKGEDGGPAMLDHCIVRMKVKFRRQGWGEVYRHPKYKPGVFTIREIGPDEVCGKENLRAKGYTHAVAIDGETHANFKSKEQAEAWVKKME